MSRFMWEYFRKTKKSKSHVLATSFFVLLEVTENTCEFNFILGAC